MRVSVALLLAIIEAALFIIGPALANHHSDHVVFYARATRQQSAARLLAREHNLRYISQVYNIISV